MNEVNTFSFQGILSVHPEWLPSTVWEFPRIRFQHTCQAKGQQRALMEAGGWDYRGW
jgi:hypothetical protein